MKFQYDANNRQKQSASLDDTGAVVSVYDAGGRRLATQVAGALTNICVYDAMGKLVAEYGQPSAGPGGTTYLTTDHVGSPRVMTNGSGGVVSRHDYLPFGEELSAGLGLRNSNQGYGGADAARQKYAGMESDDGSGMATTLWRKYDSSSGRWTSPDPYAASMTIANPQSFNRYSYVGNDPVNMRDPSGLMTQEGQPDPDNAPPPGEEPPGDPFETGRDIIAAGVESHDRTIKKDMEGGDGRQYYCAGSGAPWPSGTHDEIIADALPGLRYEDLTAIQNGSREVDVGVGYLTILPEQAYLHAMVPQSWVDKFGLEKATQMAKDAAAKFTEDKLAEARKFMAKAARSAFKDEAAGLRKIALAAFGMAMHPIMDAQSPMHKWQVYYLTGMPGVDVGFAVMHARGESGKPTSGEMSIMRDQIRTYFRSTFSNAEYQKAITPRK